MPDELLDAIEIETGPDPDAAIIWMHGLGDDGRGWSEVVPSLGLPPHLAIRFMRDGKEETADLVLADRIPEKASP